MLEKKSKKRKRAGGEIISIIGGTEVNSYTQRDRVMNN
jgi:hypothetical protein